MIEALLLIASPFVVTGIMALVKKMKMFGWFTAGSKKIVLRFTVALFSFLALVTGSLLTGEELDVVSVEMFVESLMVFLGATGIYFFSKS